MKNENGIASKEKGTVELTAQDIADLNIIFTYARRALADDEQQIIGIINLRAKIMSKLESIMNTVQNFSGKKTV